jgi:hypothetical protein
MRKIMLAGTALALLSGYTDTAMLAPMNEAATQTGMPHFEFRRGLPHGPVTITMPNGEVLHGQFRVVDNTSIGIGFAGSTSFTAIGFGGGGRPVLVQATGDQGTTIICRGTVDMGGHGGGVCETTRGARYQFMV